MAKVRFDTQTKEDTSKGLHSLGAVFLKGHLLTNEHKGPQFIGCISENKHSVKLPRF